MEHMMGTETQPLEQGDLRLLDDPVAQELLHSRNPARLAYTWLDGTPRVVAMWFEWSHGKVVMSSPVAAPKVHVLESRPRVALTIDDASATPYRELMIRGHAHVERLDDLPEEYVRAASRYLGAKQGRAWIDTLRGKPAARISVTPQWVGLIDFVTRFPSALGGIRVSDRAAG